jgi:hypothetical protein
MPCVVLKINWFLTRARATQKCPVLQMLWSENFRGFFDTPASFTSSRSTSSHGGLAGPELAIFRDDQSAPADTAQLTSWLSPHLMGSPSLRSAPRRVSARWLRAAAGDGPCVGSAVAWQQSRAPMPSAELSSPTP